MDNGTIALWLFGIPCILLAAWAWLVWKLADNARKVQGTLHELGARLKALESRLDAVQAVYDEQFRVVQKACAVGPVERRVEELEKIKRLLLAADKSNVAFLNRLDERVAGVEALLVSTVGQETEDFCRQMEGIMAKMEKPEQKEKLTLSEEFCGKFGKEKIQ